MLRETAQRWTGDGELTIGDLKFESGRTVKWKTENSHKQARTRKNRTLQGKTTTHYMDTSGLADKQRRLIAAARAATSLSLPKLLFQLGAFVFAETSFNIAAVEASHISVWKPGY